MNFIKRHFIENWLISKGWSAIDYPYPRKHIGYKYTVYSHPKERGVWDIESAIEREKLNHNPIEILEVSNK